MSIQSVIQEVKYIRCDPMRKVYTANDITNKLELFANKLDDDEISDLTKEKSI